MTDTLLANAIKDSGDRSYFRKVSLRFFCFFFFFLLFLLQQGVRLLPDMLDWIREIQPASGLKV